MYSTCAFVVTITAVYMFLHMLQWSSIVDAVGRSLIQMFWTQLYVVGTACSVLHREAYSGCRIISPICFTVGKTNGCACYTSCS